MHVHTTIYRNNGDFEEKRLCLQKWKRPTILYGKVIEIKEDHSEGELVFLFQSLSQGQSTYLDDNKKEKEMTITVTLKEDWASTVLFEKERVNLILLHPPADLSTLSITNTNDSFLIVHPDQLLTVTNIAISYTCLRRAVLGSYLTTYQDSKYSIFGRLRHDLMEVSLFPAIHTSFPQVFFSAKKYASPLLRHVLLVWFKSCIRRFSRY